MDWRIKPWVSASTHLGMKVQMFPIILSTFLCSVNVCLSISFIFTMSQNTYSGTSGHEKLLEAFVVCATTSDFLKSNYAEE